MNRIRATPATFALLTLIAIVYAFELLSGAVSDDMTLVHMGANIPGIFARGDYWRLLTAMFLHAGWLHVLSNCWALYQLGGLYEALFGRTRFLAIYFLTGIGASVASALRLDYQFLAHNIAGSSVGASGAVFGILGAFIFSIRRSPRYRHDPHLKSLIPQLVFWILLNLVIGYEVPQIDNTAHLTGLGLGLLLGFLPHRVPPPPPGNWVIDVPPQPSPPPQNQP
ncbi:MAG: rhomboid family intramembrane serine protease [Acidobacteriota bacterium]